jgi:hypothetical protein
LGDLSGHLRLWSLYKQPAMWQKVAHIQYLDGSALFSFF